MTLKPGSYIPAEVAIDLTTELETVKRVDLEMIRHMSRRIRELQKVVRVAARLAKKRTGVHMCNEATCACNLIEPLAKLKAYERKNCNGKTI